MHHRYIYCVLLCSSFQRNPFLPNPRCTWKCDMGNSCYDHHLCICREKSNWSIKRYITKFLRILLRCSEISASLTEHVIGTVAQV